MWARGNGATQSSTRRFMRATARAAGRSRLAVDCFWCASTIESGALSARRVEFCVFAREEKLQYVGSFCAAHRDVMKILAEGMRHSRRQFDAPKRRARAMARSTRDGQHGGRQSERDVVGHKRRATVTRISRSLLRSRIKLRRYVRRLQLLPAAGSATYRACRSNRAGRSAVAWRDKKRSGLRM